MGRETLRFVGKVREFIGNNPLLATASLKKSHVQEQFVTFEDSKRFHKKLFRWVACFLIQKESNGYTPVN